MSSKATACWRYSTAWPGREGVGVGVEVRVGGAEGTARVQGAGLGRGVREEMAKRVWDGGGGGQARVSYQSGHRPNITKRARKKAAD